MADRLRFPASGAGRWLTCLASVREEEKYPRKPSRYAAEGTLAHHVAELALRGWEPGKSTAITDVMAEGAEVTVDGVTHTVTADLISHTQAYVDYVDMLASRGDVRSLWVEMPLSLAPWTVEGQRGIADVVLVDPTSRTLHVVDLKYGKGVEVYAHENPQLMLYALAALTELSVFYDIDHVTVHIAQSRRSHYDSWTTSHGDLVTWGSDRVKRTVGRIIASDNVPYAPSDETCRFCRANGNCRAQAEIALSTVSEGFDAVMTLDQAAAHPDIDTRNVNALLPTEVFDCLHNVDMIKAWCKALEARAQELLEQGQAPENCGYKLVRAKTNRAWVDESAADRAMARAGVDAKERYAPRKLISPAQAEKKLGRKHDIMTGKRKKYVDKPEGALTVARESDKRDAVVIDVTAGFEAVDADQQSTQQH